MAEQRAQVQRRDAVGLASARGRFDQLPAGQRKPQQVQLLHGPDAVAWFDRTMAMPA